MSNKTRKSARLHRGKAQSLQIAETEIERLREALDVAERRNDELETVAATKLYIITAGGNWMCSPLTLEELAVTATLNGGTVLTFHQFYGRLVVK